MNEGLTIFLNLHESEYEENEALVRRVDALLLGLGMQYTGTRNLYSAIEGKDRDASVFAACKALNDAPWLAGKLACLSIMNRTSACPVEKILTEHMTEPSAAKLEYYERYYRESHTLAHGIVVDETGQLRDGYTSYLLARKYGVRPDVYEALAAQPLRKVVRGQHVRKTGDTWEIKSDKIYAWNYTLRNPVIPGDILQVKTKRGREFMCVRTIGYVTGGDFCREYRHVAGHTGERMESGE